MTITKLSGCEWAKDHLPKLRHVKFKAGVKIEIDFIPEIQYFNDLE